MNKKKITRIRGFRYALCLFFGLLFLTSHAQQKTITGKVTDQSGQQLPGVTVVVKGTTIGTVTNTDGAFSLSIPQNAETLQFSFVGMRTQDVPIGNLSNHGRRIHRY